MDYQAPQVLLIEDDEDHAELIRRALTSEDSPLESTVVRTLQEARSYLAQRTPDLIIADLRLPDGDGMDILAARPEDARFPVVVLTGHGNEEAAVSALKQGALDYVVKSRDTLTEMRRIAQHALREWKHITQRRRAEEKLRESEARYRSLFEDSPLPLWEEDFSAVKQRIDALRGSGVKDFRQYFQDHPEFVRQCISLVKILDLNQAAVTLYKAENKDQLQSNLHLVFSAGSYIGFAEELAAIAEGHRLFTFETSTQTLAGETISNIFHWVAAPGYEENLKKVFVSEIDITARKQAEEALHQANVELERRVAQRTAELVAANQRLHQEIEERHCAEEALQQQEADLCFALDAAGAVAFTWDIHEGWVCRSENAFRRDELLYFGSFDDLAARVHPEDRWSWEAKVQSALQGAGQYESEHRQIRPDNTVCWVLEKGKVTYNAAGHPVQMFGVTIDIRHQIVARQRIEDLAAAANMELAKLHAVIQSMGEALFIADTQGDFVLVNTATSAFHGYTDNKEVPKKRFQYLDVIELRTLEGCLVGLPDWPMQRVLRGETFSNLELAVWNKSTGKQWIASYNGAPVRDERGHVVLGVLTARDISAQKHVEEKLSRERDNLLNVLEAMYEGVYITDKDFNFQYVNSALRKIFGDPNGRKCYEYLHNRREACPWCHNSEVFAGKIVRSERQSPQNGRTYDVIESPLRNPDGSFSKLEILHDITDRKEAEVRLKRLQDELAHAARVKTMGEMASGLAHELNQPLAAILMKAEVGAEKVHRGKTPQKEQVMDALHFIADQAHRSGEIIRRMKHFVQKAEPKQAPLELDEAIREVTALVKGDLEHAGIQLDVALEPSLPTVCADRIQLQQVLLNLIRNALEAMEDSASEHRILALEARLQGGLVEIAVSDTGCGVPEERRQTLFNAFSSTKSGGMGLGLAICRSIVEAHGGRIWAVPNPHRGTSFFFTLPILEKDATHEFQTHRVHCG